MVKTRTYKIFSVLLMYPTSRLKGEIGVICDILKKENLLSKYHIIQLNKFINYVKLNNLLTLQELYVSIFDRQKVFSLYLFEHIHGDSRERGMAMVDLKNLYNSSNVDAVISDELPDYIPIFLEYLSLISRDKASVLLSEIIDIIAVIGRRLRLYDSPYHIIFDSMENLSCVCSDEKVVNNMMSCKIDSKVNIFDIDKEWEEPRVF